MLACLSRNLRRLATAGAVLILLAGPAAAEVTVAEVQLAARALGFLERPLAGVVRLGVVFVAGDAGSLAAAEGVVRLLGEGLAAGNVTFAPVLVRVDRVADAAVDAFFLPDGLGERARPVLAATAAKKLPCITTDIAQVEHGLCMLGVRVLPKVQIYVNRAAAAGSDTAFVSVFRMMVTEF